MKFTKENLVKYLNDTLIFSTKANDILSIGDIFISSSHDRHFRLTSFGSTVMESNFEKYTIELTNISNQNKDLLYIDKYLTTPFSFVSKTITVFDDILATELLLLDGDFSHWAANRVFWEDT